MKSDIRPYFMLKECSWAEINLLGRGGDIRSIFEIFWGQ